MARADTVTLIPLDRVATILQINPLHFNGVVSQNMPLRNACDDFWAQHNYQDAGRMSREDLASALKMAEDRVISHLGYPLVPTWISSEEHVIKKPGRPEVVSLGSFNVRGQKKSIQSYYGKVVEAGRRGLTLIDDNAAVVYSDADSDNYKETATVVVATTLTDPEEIYIFYPGKGGSPRWEIRPVNVSIAGGNATITFRREQAVIESELEKLTDHSANDQKVDGDDDANFLTVVDVYRVYNDISQQAIFYSEGTCGSCDGSGCDVCGYTAETGCLYIRDSRLGFLAYDRADWDADQEKYVSASFSFYEPDKIKIWYRAGMRDETLTFPNRQMDPMWERMVALYAFTFMGTEKIPGCDNTRKLVEVNTVDLALQTTTGGTFQVAKIVDCPLGTSKIAWQIWNQLSTKNGQLVTAR